MNEKDCIEFRDAQAVASYCQNKDKRSEFRVLNCMEVLYFSHFKNIYKSWTISSTLHSPNDQLKIAFNDGLRLLYDQLRDYGWEERGISIKQALLTYCGNQLRKLRTDLLRDNKRKDSGDPKEKIEGKNGGSTSGFSLEEKETRREREEIFRKVFLQLDKKSRDFMLWQKLHELSEETMQEIYPEVDLKSRQPDDIVYRCTVRLKKLVDQFKNK